MTQPARIPSTYPGEAAWCRSVMATLRLRPVTGRRGGSWVPNPRRTRATRVRRRRCNSVGAPRGASGPLTTRMCGHDLAGCHRTMGCLGQGEEVGTLSNRSHVPTHAQSRAEIGSSRARVPYTAECQFSPPTALRPAALQSKRSRYLPAYADVELVRVTALPTQEEL